MTLHVAGPRVAAFINFEVSQQFRETGMLKAGDVYLPGTVLGVTLCRTRFLRLPVPIPGMERLTARQ
jgi:hypothetical protein